MDKKSVEFLEEIKKNLILGLITQGVKAKDIVQVLGVNKSTITRIVALRQLNSE